MYLDKLKMQPHSLNRQCQSSGSCGPISLSILMTLVLFWFAVGHAQAAGFELITPAEYQLALESPEVDDGLVAKAVIGSPDITVVSPVLSDGSLNSPVDIEVQFTPQGTASIDMSSLKIFYVMFIKKDVTDRIMEHADVGDNMIVASGAKLPAGKHKFILRIADTEKRIASKKFTITVGG